MLKKMLAGVAAGILLLAPQSLVGTAQSFAQGGPPPDDTATVIEVGSSDKLLVQNDAGLTYRVQYIGLRGPVRSSIFQIEAAAYHASIVAGQRVVLESDGRDEEEGYKLRHSYLAGDPVPIGARALAEGWAVAAPYPLEHRHRVLYLDAQREALIAQRRLWEPGAIGPAAPWRRSETEAGYIAADPDLHSALDVLDTVPTGQSIIRRLVRIVPIIQLRNLAPNVGGSANPLANTITMNRNALGTDARTAAAAIAHEGTHIVDFVSSNLELAAFSCFELEQRSHGIQAQVWSELYGSGGKAEPLDDWERSNNNVLRFAQRGDLENYVRRSAGYEAQCARERVPS